MHPVMNNSTWNKIRLAMHGLDGPRQRASIFFGADCMLHIHSINPKDVTITDTPKGLR